jgi:catechol 2,3-dioxygenase-like lactoylglutathione lyase family enzyme
VPSISGVYETVLYAADVPQTAAFYEQVLGLRLLEADELAAAFRLSDGGVLLLFDPTLSAQPGRPVPSHGANGPGHVALTVQPGSLEEAKSQLLRQGIRLEREVEWDEGGRSLYVRDPAGNSVELIDGEAWRRD